MFVLVVVAEIPLHETGGYSFWSGHKNKLMVAMKPSLLRQRRRGVSARCALKTQTTLVQTARPPNFKNPFIINSGPNMFEHGHPTGDFRMILQFAHLVHDYHAIGISGWS